MELLLSHHAKLYCFWFENRSVKYNRALSCCTAYFPDISLSLRFYYHFLGFLHAVEIVRVTFILRRVPYDHRQVLTMVSKFLSLPACLTLSICASASLPVSSGSSIGSYAYIGCLAEPLSGAVPGLVGTFYANDIMALEQCSSNCAGAYQYLGVEYGREVSISNS